MGKHTLDYTRDRQVAKPATIWDQDEPPPVVQRGPWRGPAVIAVVIAWLLNTSPKATRERAMYRHAVSLNLLTLACNVALFELGLVAMVAGFHGIG